MQGKPQNTPEKRHSKVPPEAPLHKKADNTSGHWDAQLMFSPMLHTSKEMCRELLDFFGLEPGFQVL